ncbi:hypothetical protein CNEO3_630047 [Clostridium neonatale]|uniref:hypothetical protein n=1 Tax=Clostridium neonatale TaxID=137838 RepID=UPI00291C2728|nr:hypothetical protein CNEO3_630047 [Clostridium neonatale]
MERLADYTEKADEIVRLSMNDGYRVNDAIKIVKEMEYKKVEGYIKALIDIHYMRLGRLGDNRKYEQNYEMSFIEELENLLNYYKKAIKDTDQSSPR